MGRGGGEREWETKIKSNAIRKMFVEIIIMIIIKVFVQRKLFSGGTIPSTYMHTGTGTREYIHCAQFTDDKRGPAQRVYSLCTVYR